MVDARRRVGDLKCSEVFDGLDENLIGNDALQKFSEWIAERKNFSQVFRGEIRASSLGVSALAADLYNAYDLIAGENGRADDFLD